MLAILEKIGSKADQEIPGHFRFNWEDIFDLLRAYYTPIKRRSSPKIKTLLQLHDMKPPIQKAKAIPIDHDDKHGQTLIMFVDYPQLDRVMGILRSEPVRAHRNYPLQEEWHEYVIRVMLHLEDETHNRNRLRPGVQPRHKESTMRKLIYLIYEECFSTKNDALV